jgi:hypothetical protein
MEGIIWTDGVINAGVLQKVKGDRNVLQKTKKGANSIGQIFHENCLLKRIIEEKIDGRI